LTQTVLDFAFFWAFFWVFFVAFFWAFLFAFAFFFRTLWHLGCFLAGGG